MVDKYIFLSVPVCGPYILPAHSYLNSTSSCADYSSYCLYDQTVVLGCNAGYANPTGALYVLSRCLGSGLYDNNTITCEGMCPSIHFLLFCVKPFAMEMYLILSQHCHNTLDENHFSKPVNLYLAGKTVYWYTLIYSYMCV